MAVVAHHPVVVHLESIACGGSSVEEDAAVSHLKVVAFVHFDGAFVDGQVG